MSIGDATSATGGLWIYYDISDGKLKTIVTNNSTTVNTAHGAGTISESTFIFFLKRE